MSRHLYCLKSAYRIELSACSSLRLLPNWIFSSAACSTRSIQSKWNCSFVIQLICGWSEEKEHTMKQLKTTIDRLNWNWITLSICIITQSSARHLMRRRRVRTNMWHCWFQLRAPCRVACTRRYRIHALERAKSDNHNDGHVSSVIRITEIEGTNEFPISSLHIKAYRLSKSIRKFYQIDIHCFDRCGCEWIS